MKGLMIRPMERMSGAELTAHPGHDEGKEAPARQRNRRNGASTKVLKGQDGELSVAVPRDRDSSFAPGLVKKDQTRIGGMDDKIIGLYAAGLTDRDIQAHLLDVCGLRAPDLISRVSDAVLGFKLGRATDQTVRGIARRGRTARNGRAGCWIGCIRS